VQAGRAFPTSHDSTTCGEFVWLWHRHGTGRGARWTLTFLPRLKATKSALVDDEARSRFPFDPSRPSDEPLRGSIRELIHGLRRLADALESRLDGRPEGAPYEDEVAMGLFELEDGLNTIRFILTDRLAVATEGSSLFQHYDDVTGRHVFHLVQVLNAFAESFAELQSAAFAFWGPDDEIIEHLWEDTEERPDTPSS
jgi:hypothetical protein